MTDWDSFNTIKKWVKKSKPNVNVKSFCSSSNKKINEYIEDITDLISLQELYI